MTIVIAGRNVNDLYPQALNLIRRDGVREMTRAGEVLSLPHPVVSVTDRPMERVLFDEKRDANPFFHMFECLWMLHGMADGTWLDRFVGDFSSRFGEPGGMIWGAYGSRWRYTFGFDQLDAAVRLLRNDRSNRRVVIAMWDPNHDMCGESKKDHPCNTHIYPRIVNGALDITVCVRSNDIIWGAYGANAVHMTFLQEYLAARIGVPVGKFYQFSNNWHAYTNVLDRFPMDVIPPNPYVQWMGIEPAPIVRDPDYWDDDLEEFMANPATFVGMRNPWFMLTAQRAWIAHDAYKNKDWDKAFHFAEAIEATDWRFAMTSWLQRRRKKQAQKDAK